MAGRIVEICVEDDARVAAGAPVAVIEAMKTEHLVLADRAGRVKFARARAGDHLAVGEALLFLLDAEAEANALAASEVEQDPDFPALISSARSTVSPRHGMRRGRLHSKNVTR
jgi:pyruvate/2-oxoglutarate dehydrogenase complex dihydrolipoamide acyltransferase (E2) component